MCRVDAHGLGQRVARALEAGFQNVMGVLARELHKVDAKVMGLMNCVAFCVISTSTSQCCFNSIRATLAILYAAILPEIARTTVFPFSIVVSFCLIYQKYFKTVLLKYHKCIFYANITFLFVRDMI